MTCKNEEAEPLLGNAFIQITQGDEDGTDKVTVVPIPSIGYRIQTDNLPDTMLKVRIHIRNNDSADELLKMGFKKIDATGIILMTPRTDKPYVW